MKKISRQDAIYQLALAGISAALATVFVTLGVFVRFSTVAFFIAAGLSLMVPLAKRYVASSIAAFAVSGVAAFFIAGDIATVAGYIIYFGPMSILTGIFFNRKVKWYIALPVKIVYINGALATLYFALKTIVIDASIMDLLPYWSIAVIGTILLVVIDIALQFIYSKLIPLVEKVVRGKKDAKPAEPAEDDEDPFEEDLYSDIYDKQSDDPQNEREELAEKPTEDIETPSKSATDGEGHSGQNDDMC